MGGKFHYDPERRIWQAIANIFGKGKQVIAEGTNFSEVNKESVSKTIKIQKENEQNSKNNKQ